MAEEGAEVAPIRVPTEAVPCTNAIRALQFGLTALFFLFATLATFGPWFNLALAYVLTGASIVAGLMGLVLAHDASHRLRRNPSETGGTYAKLGAVTSASAVLVSSYYNGFLAILLHPIALPLCITLLFVFVVFHWRTSARDDEIRRSRVSPCGRCGRPTLLENVRWRGTLGMCRECVHEIGGVPT